MAWLPRITRTISVRQGMVGIAFLALLMALMLQTWRFHEREARLLEQLQRTQYELVNTKHILLSERFYRDHYGPAQQSRARAESDAISTASTGEEIATASPASRP